MWGMDMFVGGNNKNLKKLISMAYTIIENKPTAVNFPTTLVNVKGAKTKLSLGKTQIINLNNAINSGNLTETGMQEALAEKKYYEREVLQARGEVLWAFNKMGEIDSTVNSTDSIIAFLTTENDAVSKKLLVATYYLAGKYNDANNVLSELSNDGSAEMTNFIAYYTLLINANQVNRNIFQLTAGEWTNMEQIAATNTSTAESAKGILTLVKGNYYFNEIEKDVNGLGKNSPILSTPENKSEVTSKNNLFVVFPNPADGQLFINYHVNDIVTNSTITVTNILGKTILVKTVNKVKGLIDLDTKNWANGTYFLQLTNGNKVINTSTVIITH